MRRVASPYSFPKQECPCPSSGLVDDVAGFGVPSCGSLCCLSFSLLFANVFGLECVLALFASRTLSILLWIPASLSCPCTSRSNLHHPTASPAMASSCSVPTWQVIITTVCRGCREKKRNKAEDRETKRGQRQWNETRYSVVRVRACAECPDGWPS